jgi:putative ABC transport system permease protein
MSTPGRRLRDIFRNARAEASDEIDFHLEMREREFRERGMSAPEARVAARRRFGDVEIITNEVRAIDDWSARQQRRTGMWTDLGQDIVYALRALRKAPGFTAVAVVTLALGIGANTAIFSLINAVLLRPLPFPNPDGLVFMWNARAGSGDLEPIGPGRMMDFRSQMTSFAGFAGISHLSFTLSGSGEPEQIEGSSVSSPFFDVLGVRPLVGETFHANAADPTAVVLSYRLWSRRFNQDRTLIGRTITLNQRVRTIVAVMPQDFVWPVVVTHPSPGDIGPELWVPGGPGDVPRPATNEDEDVRGYRNAGYLRAVARLKPGVPFAAARAEAESVGARLSRTYAEDDGRGATLVTIRDQFSGAVRRPLLVLGGAVIFVLAIAAANIASLLLGRAADRRREIAVRRALGAATGRIVRQLLTEAVVLSAAGAVAGLMVSWWLSSSLISVAPADMAGLVTLADPRVLAFTLLVTGVVGVAFGTVPALEASRVALTPALTDGGTRASGSRRTTRLRDVLVASQIAVALVLLAGSTLLVRSFMRLTRVDTGIATHNLMTFDVRVSGERGAYQSKQVAFYTEMLDRLRAIPGVTAAGAAVTLPIGGDDFGTGYVVEGRPASGKGRTSQAGYQIVMPGYFAAMGIPLRAGRDFRMSDDRQSMPVVMVNERLARQQWPGEDPIGRRLRFDDSGAWMTVVGVVGDIRHLGPSVPPRPELYQSVTQRSFPFIAVVVRTESDPYGVLPSIRRSIAELDPALPLAHARTMDEHIAHALSRPRFLSGLISGFGAVAVTLAVIGIYGMMAWSVVQRRREIAVRVALGARGTAVLNLVLLKALRLTAIGVAGGLAAAWAASGVLSGLLYGVDATDALALAATAAIVGGVALAAAYLPARRALRVNPVTLLR